MISGCILAKNEEKNIVPCIKSILPVCEEIIVIDNGSTDDTGELAREWGAKVYFDDSSNFDLLKNKFHDLATKSWIFSIDADERLAAGTDVMIKKTVSSAPEDVWGYTIPKLSYSGRGQWSESNYLELYRNRSEICYSNTSIHANLTDSINRHGKKIGRLWTPIHHVDALVRNTKYKRDRYISLITENISDFKKQNEPTYYLECFLASEYLYADRKQEAKAILERLIERYPDKGTMAYTFLSQLFYVEHRYDESLELSNYVISSLREKHKFSLFNIARIHSCFEHYDLAEKVLQKYMDHYPESCTGYYNLAYVFWKQSKDYLPLLNIAFSINEMLKEPIIYDNRPKSIYLNETIVFDFEQRYLDLLKEKAKEQ